MSTPSEKCCALSQLTASQLTQVITGVVVLTGLATFVWLAHTRHATKRLDPLTEADRRLGELEDSLARLQESFRQAVTH